LPNVDKLNSRSVTSMNFKYIAMVAVIAATLVGTTVITADRAFAYEKSQATSQANACGNGFLPENVYCQNIGSQVQGDENAVALDGFQD
jgi:hypothetical protein